MGRYRARDLVNAPTLVSLLRIPLAAAFPFAFPDPALALVTLAAAGLTDVIDGQLARRTGKVTATGAVVDGITDKTFVAVVLLTLLRRSHLALSDIALLGARELGELPLLLWLLASEERRRGKVEDKANVFGKVATTLQFATIVVVIVDAQARAPWVWATAAAGALAALSYWRRALSPRGDRD